MSSLNGTRPLNFGLVGLGYWGPNLLRVLSDDPSVSLSWICDLDESRLARFHHRHPGASVTTQVQDLLDDEDLDAVVIATPVFTHYELCARSLQAAKHTFVEKPLADSLAKADELFDM